MEAAHCLKIDVSGARNTIFFNFDFINLQNEPIFNTHVLLSPRLVLLSPGLPLLSHSLVLLSHSLVLLSPCLVSLCLSWLATHLSFLWSNRRTNILAINQSCRDRNLISINSGFTLETIQFNIQIYLNYIVFTHYLLLYYTGLYWDEKSCCEVTVRGPLISGTGSNSLFFTTNLHPSHFFLTEILPLLEVQIIDL